MNPIKRLFDYLFLRKVEWSEEEKCHLCGRTLKTDYSVNTYRFFSYYDFEQIHENAIREIGWRRIWITNGGLVCPVCIRKLEWALIPGVGVKLVPPAMISGKQAISLEEIKGAQNETEMEKRKERDGT